MGKTDTVTSRYNKGRLSDLSEIHVTGVIHIINNAISACDSDNHQFYYLYDNRYCPYHQNVPLPWKPSQNLQEELIRPFSFVAPRYKP